MKILINDTLIADSNGLFQRLSRWICRLHYCQATGTGDGDGNPVPGDDSIIFGATHPPPSTTLNHVRDLWQQSAFSKNVSGWSPKPFQQKKLPGGQQQ